MSSQTELEQDTMVPFDLCNGSNQTERIVFCPHRTVNLAVSAKRDACGLQLKAEERLNVASTYETMAGFGARRSGIWLVAWCGK